MAHLSTVTAPPHPSHQFDLPFHQLKGCFPSTWRLSGLPCNTYNLQPPQSLVTLRRASPLVLSMCDTAKIFFTSKFSYLLFTTPPTHQTQTGVSKYVRWGITNSKPLEPIITMGHSETRITSQIVYLFITLFSAGAERCCTFFQPWQTVHYT